MNESEAKKILGIAIERGDGLYTNLDGAIAWNTDDEKIIMEGEFTPEYLEAVAWWIKNKKRPTESIG